MLPVTRESSSVVTTSGGAGSAARFRTRVSTASWAVSTRLRGDVLRCDVQHKQQPVTC